MNSGFSTEQAESIMASALVDRELATLTDLWANRSRTSLAAYYRFVFRRPIPPHLGLVIECLQAIDDGSIDRLLVIAPPGHAKSTVVSLAFPSWYIGRHPEQSIIGASTTARVGELFTDAIAELIERDERFKLTFPKVFPWKARGWSKDGLFVTRPWSPGQKDASITFVGAGGPIISRRGDGLILDDTVDEPVARSDIRLGARRTWVQQSVRSRLKPNGWVVAVGTTWGEADVVGLLKDMGTFVTVTLRALNGQRVYADLVIPEHIDWRPTGAEPV